MKLVTKKQIKSVMNWAKDYAKAAVKYSKDYDKAEYNEYHSKLASKYFDKFEAVCMTLARLRIVDNWRQTYDQLLDDAYLELSKKQRSN